VADRRGVVDADLKFLAHDNLYACDNSVLPSSHAANPPLTLAALSHRTQALLPGQVRHLARDRRPRRVQRANRSRPCCGLM
jgi:choline dehydrogenase-like flavoprotein